MAKNGTDPIAAYEVERTRLADLQADAPALEHRVQELLGKIASHKPDRIGDAARALLDGRSMDEASDFTPELEDVRQRLAVVRRAIDIQRQKVDATKAARDNAICDKAEPKVRGAAQEFAEFAVRFSEAAERFYGLFDGLQEQGVQFTHRFPGLALAPLRAAVPESRINILINELVRDYNVTVKRPILDAEVERARKAHEREQAELRALRERDEKERRRRLYGAVA